MGTGEPAAWGAERTRGPAPARELEEVRLRGLAFHSAMTALVALEGPAALSSTMERLEGSARGGLIQHGVTASSWYPVSWYGELLRAMQAATGRGADLSRDVGRVSVTQDFRGIFRHVLRFASPDLLARHAVGVYGFYARGGELRSLDRGRGFARYRWDGCGGYDADIWQDNFGGCAALFELSGGRDIHLEVLEGGVADFAEIRVTWR